MARFVIETPGATEVDLGWTFGQVQTLGGYVFAVLGAVPEPSSGRHGAPRVCPGCEQLIPKPAP